MRTFMFSLLTLVTFAFAAPVTFAQSADEAAVAKAVELLRLAMFARDPKGYAALISENVSYGHSAGRIENKQEFIKASLANPSVMKSLTFTDQTIQVDGTHAIVRNTYNGVSERDGKTTNTKIGVLMVWANEGGTWRLYARQAFRL
ncbi:MAG: nuclear transport factor 2 family protein [Betaproteobacteria bacterium]|nr:nuclear transport factor 2 family protein [Betaproteobacteria bacterium]